MLYFKKQGNGLSFRVNVAKIKEERNFFGNNNVSH